MRQRVWMGGLFLALAASAEKAAAPSALNLKALLERASAKNLNLVQSRSVREKAENSVTIARSSLLPSLTLSSSFDYTKRLTGVSDITPWTSEGTVAVQQTLFKNGTLWRSYLFSAKELDQARLQEKLAHEEFALGLVKAFAQSSLLGQKFHSSQRKEKLLELQHDIVKRQYMQGLKTQRDFHRLDAEMERSRLQRAQSEEAYQASLRGLEILVGDEDFRIAPESLEPLLSDKILQESRWTAAAPPDLGKQNSEVQILDLGVQKAELTQREADWGMWPQLDVHAGVQYGSGQFVGPDRVAWGDNDGTQFVAGLTLKWALWDWGARSAARAKARSDSLVAERARDQRSLEVTRHYENLAATLERLKRSLPIDRKIRDLEHTNFAEIQKEYRLGQANYLDLITALDQDVNSENSFEEQASQYFQTIAEIKKLNGELYDSILAL
jgi:outer membrane protein TolC